MGFVLSRFLIQSKLPQADTLGKRKKCPQLELAAYGNVYIQSLYELEFKQAFVKAAISRAVCCLRECPLRELHTVCVIVFRVVSLLCRG